MKYKCSYESGSGTEYQDGEWERKDTPKTITLTKTAEYLSGVFANHKVGEKIRVGNNTGNPLRELEEGSFVVYFNQAGTPYTFEPIENPDISPNALISQ